MVWGGVVSLSFREVFYRIGASECYSYVCVFEEVSNFAYLLAVIYEGCPCFMTVVSFFVDDPRVLFVVLISVIGFVGNCSF
jgi:hypothetical protein